MTDQELIERARNLLVLNEPEHGGPYQGAAAHAFIETLSAIADRLKERDEQLADWFAECDKVGIAHDPELLVRHHRANAGMAGRLEGFCDAQVMHRPHRGSDVEAWIKHWRDKFSPDNFVHTIIDDILDDYRLMADTGDEAINKWLEER